MPNDKTSTLPDAVALARSMPAVPENRAHRFAHVDALRAFAVLLVVIEHSGFTISPGDSGVTVFFTISGFVITSLLLSEMLREGRFDIGRFYRRRALKLFPPFAVALLIPTLIWAALVPAPPVGVILSQVFFSYNWAMVFATEASQQAMPGSGVLWSLGVEEQFYIVFAIVWLLLLRGRRPLLGTGVLAVSAIVLAHVLRVYYLVEQYPRDWALRGTPARMDAIAWGVLLALAVYLHRSGRLGALRRFASDRLLIVAVLLYPVLAVVQATWWEKLVRPGLYPLIACEVILYGMLAPRSPLRSFFDAVCSNRVISMIGLASYSIYIAHGAIVALVELVVPGVGQLPLAVQSPLFVLIGVATGLLLYRLVEVPVLRLRNRMGW